MGGKFLAIDPCKGSLIAKKNPGKCPDGLGFAHSCWPHEKHGQQGALRVLNSGQKPAQAVGQFIDGSRLSYHLLS